MRILQLCHKPPVPPVDGGCIAMHKITEGLLSQGFEVRILSMETFKHPLLNERIDREFTARTRMETSFVDIRVKRKDALLNLFSSQSYNISRFYDRQFEKKLIAILREDAYDIVLFESLYTSMYLDTVKKHSRAKTIYRAHNIEFRIWEYHFRLEKNMLKRQYLKLLHRRLKDYELDIVRHFDGIAAINEEEGAFFNRKLSGNRVVVIPVTINTRPVQQAPVNTLSFFHIGSMDWTPNQDGIRWLLEEVWRDIADHYPDTTLHLAGRKMPAWLLQLEQKNVIIHGEVRDAFEFMEDHQVMIVPLFSASGVRIKILEAMSMGKTVLCTSVAAEGIPFTAGKDLLIANTAEEFRESIQRILSGETDLEKIGRQALERIRSTYDNQEVTRRLTSFFNEILNY